MSGWNEDDGHTDTQTQTQTLTHWQMHYKHMHTHHVVEYEEDPLSAVYCTHGWRWDTDEGYKPFFELFPLMLKLWREMKPICMQRPMPLRIDTIYHKPMLNVFLHDYRWMDGVWGSVEGFKNMCGYIYAIYAYSVYKIY